MSVSPAVTLPSPYAMATRLLVSSALGACLPRSITSPGRWPLGSRTLGMAGRSGLLPLSPSSRCHCCEKDTVSQWELSGAPGGVLGSCVSGGFLPHLGGRARPHVGRWGAVALGAGGEPTSGSSRPCLPTPTWGTVAGRPRCAS